MQTDKITIIDKEDLLKKVEDITNNVQKSELLQYAKNNDNNYPHPYVFTIANTEEELRVKNGNFVFLKFVKAPWFLEVYNKEYKGLNKKNNKFELVYNEFLEEQESRQKIIEQLKTCNITKAKLAGNLIRRFYTNLHGLSAETSTVSFDANDDFAATLDGNIVFSHVIDNEETEKERMFHNIPVKLCLQSQHLLCNNDGSPTQLLFARKETKFLQHNLDNAVLFLKSANEFSFTSNDNISFNIKCEKEKNGQYQYFYQQIKDNTEGPWTKFDMKTSFYIPPLEQDVMWQKMINKYPIMKKYKSKIFPKIEKIVKDKESDKKTMKYLEDDIKTRTNALEVLKNNFPNNPNIQVHTNLIEQNKKQIGNIKSKKYPSINDLVKDFAEKTKNLKILQEIAEKTKNWKILQDFAEKTKNLKILQEIAEKTKNWKFLQEYAIKHNNPTLYWKAVMNERRKRNKKIDYQKCGGERGWIKTNNKNKPMSLIKALKIGKKF